MYRQKSKIINKYSLGEEIKRFDIEDDIISEKAKPGQYVIVMSDSLSERIPLFIIDTDKKKKSFSVVVDEKSRSTRRLGAMRINDSLHALLGPLGTPIEAKKLGVVVCVGYEAGVAHMLPVCRDFKRLDNKVIGILGASTKKRLILEPQMRLGCHKIYMSTEDGSYENRGSVVDALKEVADMGKVRLVHAMAPVALLEDVCRFTAKRKIKTKVSLEPITIDGMGIGAMSRLNVGEEMLLSCIEGPTFDGHALRFKELKSQIEVLKELRGCQQRKFQSSLERNGSKILPKFLSDMVKSKP